MRKKKIIIFCVVLMLILFSIAGVLAFKVATKIETQVKALSTLEWLYPLQKVYDIKVKNDCFAIYASDKIKRTYIDRAGKEVDAETVEQSHDEKEAESELWPDFNGEIPGAIAFGPFSEGKAVIYEAEKVYCIDEQGHVLYEKPLSHGDEMVHSYYLINRYVNGRIQLYDGWKCGIVDERGDWLIEPIFHEIEIVDDFAIVTFGERMGIIHLT